MNMGSNPDTPGNFFAVDKLDAATKGHRKVVQGPYAIGIDFGRGKSVASVVVVEGTADGANVLAADQVQYTEGGFDAMLAAVADLVDSYPNANTHADATGVGDTLIDQLGKRTISASVTGLVLTARVKKALVDVLGEMVDKGQLWMPPDRKLYEQLAAYAGDAPTADSGYHDDLVIALALACQGLWPAPRPSHRSAGQQSGRSRFETTNLTPGQAARVNQTREAFATLEAAITQRQRGTSRELSLALTALEESCMWAIKAISREGDREP